MSLLANGGGLHGTAGSDFTKDGNDAIASWHAVARAMDYVRRERRPFFIEARVSRLYGHSSASGANFVANEVDPLPLFEERLLESGVLSRKDLARLREVTASQGLMLESISERLMDTVHAGSPTKHPRHRIDTIAAAGELKIPFTSGILVGIGE